MSLFLWVLVWEESVHPSIHPVTFQCSLLRHSGSHGGAGAYPRCLCEGGAKSWTTVYHRATWKVKQPFALSLTPKANLDFPVEAGVPGKPTHPPRESMKGSNPQPSCWEVTLLSTTLPVWEKYFIDIFCFYGSMVNHSITADRQSNTVSFHVMIASFSFLDTS